MNAYLDAGLVQPGMTLALAGEAVPVLAVRRHRGWVVLLGERIVVVRFPEHPVEVTGAPARPKRVRP